MIGALYGDITLSARSECACAPSTGKRLLDPMSLTSPVSSSSITVAGTAISGPENAELVSSSAAGIKSLARKGEVLDLAAEAPSSALSSPDKGDEDLDENSENDENGEKRGNVIAGRSSSGVGVESVCDDKEDCTIGRCKITGEPDGDGTAGAMG
ncbi:MAG: hypothetical protein ACRCWB_07155 [Enterovibrio sp.]